MAFVRNDLEVTQVHDHSAHTLLETGGPSRLPQLERCSTSCSTLRVVDWGFRQSRDIYDAVNSTERCT